MIDIAVAMEIIEKLPSSCTVKGTRKKIFRYNSKDCLTNACQKSIGKFISDVDRENMIGVCGFKNDECYGCHKRGHTAKKKC